MSTFFVILHDAEPADDSGRAHLRENLESKLGLQPDRIEQIFASLPVILKENMKEADADSYIRVLERLGASVEKLPESNNASEEQTPESIEENSLASLEEESDINEKAYELDLDADYSVEDLEGMLDEVLQTTPQAEETKQESASTPTTLDLSEEPDSSDDELSFSEMSAGLEFHLSGETEQLHTGPDKPVTAGESEDGEGVGFDDLELAPAPEQLETTSAISEPERTAEKQAEDDLDAFSLDLSPDPETEDSETPLDTQEDQELEEFDSAEETLSTLSKQFDVEEIEDEEELETAIESDAPEGDFEDSLIARLESGEVEENRAGLEHPGARICLAVV